MQRNRTIEIIESIKLERRGSTLPPLSKLAVESKHAVSDSKDKNIAGNSPTSSPDIDQPRRIKTYGSDQTKSSTADILPSIRGLLPHSSSESNIHDLPYRIQRRRPRIAIHTPPSRSGNSSPGLGANNALPETPLVLPSVNEGKSYHNHDSKKTESTKPVVKRKQPRPARLSPLFQSGKDAPLEKVDASKFTPLFS